MRIIKVKELINNYSKITPLNIYRLETIILAVLEEEKVRETKEKYTSLEFRKKLIRSNGIRK